MNKRRLIFLDIDNTVYSEQDGISLSTVNAIRQAKDNGHQIIFNTGRIKNNIPEDILKLNPDGVITSAGAHVEVEGKCILNLTMDKKDLYALCSFFAKHQVVFHISTNTETFVWNGSNDLYKKAINKLSYHHALVSEGKILSDIGEYGNVFVSPLDFEGRCNGEIFIKNINKATGIQAVLQYYNTDREDTVAFGDAQIDLEMLQFAGIGVAMGNALQEVKQVADMITMDYNKDGIQYGFTTCNLI